MKSRLFCANSSDAAMHTIIRVLGKTRLEDILAKREMQYTLIVPNRFAMTAEREIFDMLDLPGAADIDVAPFSWLAINLLKSGPKRRCLTHETATLVLKRVIDSVKGDLRRYARAADSSGFAKETFDVINSVRSCGYTTDDLYLAAEKVGGLSIASKIRDIARICEGYEQALVNIDDSITRLDRLAREIKNIPSVVNTRYYVACFNKFSAKEKRILRELIQYAPSLDIATATDNGGKNRTLYPIGFAGEIESISEEAGVETDMVIVKEQMIEPFATINSELFAFSGKTCETNTENVIVYRENTIYDEANFVACEIAWLVKHKQYRYKDIAIINCNPAFVDILTSILNRYKIPFFADIKYPLSNSIAVNYLLAALDARAFEYRRDKVLRLIKSSAFGISVEESCAFENYVIKYNVTHNGFSKPFEYGDTAIAEKVRAMLFKRVPAKGIEGGKCKAVDFIKYCRRIIDIGDSGNKTPFCRSYDQAIEEIVDVRLSAVNSKALGRLNTILDDMEELLGDYTTSFLLHIETLKSTIAAVQISLIPQSLDSVFIGNIIESRFSGIKTAFITGASFGMLPSEQGTFAILSATDSDILADNGIKLYPAPADLMKEEEYLLLDIIARIKDRLYIGYATTLPDGTVQRPSTAFTEICNIAKIVPHSYAQRYSPASAESSDQLADCAVTQENAYFQYLTGMGKSFEYDEAARHNFNILYASLGDELKSRVDLLAETYIDTFKPPIDFFFDPIENNFAVSVSQLESYFRCPHLHYLRYGADIKERETADLKYVDVGNIVHKSLELYFSRTIGRLRDSTQEGVQFLAATAKSAVKEAIATGLKRDVEENVGKANLIYRLECECLKAITELTNSVLRSVFDPKYIETSFGFGQVFPAVKIEINEQVFMLRGKIDRIDTYNDKTVVIDYKTGSTSSDLKDVYCGIKIQLFAYLNAIATGGGIPVAAYYIPIRDSYETEKDASYGVIGHVLNYPEMYEDFDKQAYDEACRTKEKTSSPNWPFNVRYKKKAGIVEATSKTSILSESIFNKFIEYSIDVARNGIDEICDGYSQCSPISGGRGHACEMCAYMRICGADGEKNARVKPKLPHCLSNADQDESDKQPQEVIEG